MPPDNNLTTDEPITPPPVVATKTNVAAFFLSAIILGIIQGVALGWFIGWHDSNGAHDVPILPYVVPFIVGSFVAMLLLFRGRMDSPAIGLLVPLVVSTTTAMLFDGLTRDHGTGSMGAMIFAFPPFSFLLWFTSPLFSVPNALAYLAYYAYVKYRSEGFGPPTDWQKLGRHYTKIAVWAVGVFVLWKVLEYLFG